MKYDSVVNNRSSICSEALPRQKSSSSTPVIAKGQLQLHRRGDLGRAMYVACKQNFLA